MFVTSLFRCVGTRMLSGDPRVICGAPPRQAIDDERLLTRLWPDDPRLPEVRSTDFGPHEIFSGCSAAPTSWFCSSSAYT